MAKALYLKNQWTWLVTDIESVSLTFLNHLATNVQMAFVLNQAAQALGDLPSDNPEVNILAGDGDPFVSFNNRLLYGFRREGGGPPYVCRFSGILHILEDEAQVDQPITHFTAFDPWMWLNSIPVVTAAGDLLGEAGLSYRATRGNTIALDLLTNGLAAVVASNPGNPIFIDQVDGTIENTDPIDIVFQQGVSVGEAWTQLTDTGSLDIVLDPVYDPASRPGVLSVLSIYNQAGARRNDAVFAWDRPPRSLVGIDRLDDGTQMANVAQFYTSGAAAKPQATDATSIAKYGEYWLQRSFPGPAASSAVALIALAQVALRKRGQRTITIDPAPEVSPDPFVDYFLGDQIPVYAGRPTVGGGTTYREQLDAGVVSGGHWTNLQRVYGMPIRLDDDQVETVEQLLLTDSFSEAA